MISRQRRKLEIKKEYRATMRVKCEPGAKERETDRKKAAETKKEKYIE
jgi:hypothetical protein